MAEAYENSEMLFVMKVKKCCVYNDTGKNFPTFIDKPFTV